MTFNEFKAAVVKELKDRYPDAQITEQKVVKTNDEMKDGLVVMKPGTNISPTVYLADLYEAGMSVEKVISAIEKNFVEDSFDVSSFTDWNRVQGNIVYKLINGNANKELLSDVPFKKVDGTDLVLVFMVLVKVNGQNGTILIHNSHLEGWGVTVEDLYVLAEKNTPALFPAQIEGMPNFIASITGAPVDDNPLTIVTNEDRTNGACVILYKDVLKKIAVEKGVDKLYVIPSSVHECLVLPATEAFKKDYLDGIVREVNETTLAPNEVLGNCVYTYDTATDTIAA